MFKKSLEFIPVRFTDFIRTHPCRTRCCVGSRRNVNDLFWTQ